MIERHLSRAGVDTPMLGVVPKFSRTPGAISDVGPTLGEHTAHYLSCRGVRPRDGLDRYAPVDGVDRARRTLGLRERVDEPVARRRRAAERQALRAPRAAHAVRRGRCRRRRSRTVACCCCGATGSSATRGAGRCPAGRVDPGETPEECAARETLEETGWRAGELTKLTSYRPHNGTSDAHFHLYRTSSAELRRRAVRPRRGRAHRMGRRGRACATRSAPAASATACRSPPSSGAPPSA